MKLKARWYKLKSKILTIFGDIHVYKYPMFVVYYPGSFKVTGEKCRVILDKIQAGDVMLRGYDNYLDSFFIPVGKSKCSHSGVYVGDNNIIHSIAEGVTCEDVLNFCRADRVVILRPKVSDEDKKRAVLIAKSCVGKPYDFNFDTSDTEGVVQRRARYFCHEFTKSCYPEIPVGKKVGKAKFLGLKSSPIYLADSFYLNDAFEKIYKSGAKNRDMNDDDDV